MARRKKPPDQRQKAHASKAVAARRVDEVLRIRLDGAEFWDVREFTREKEGEKGSDWHLADGDNPMSDGQIGRYIAKADKAIEASAARNRKKLIRRHTAKRRNLYAKSVMAGDLRTALACLSEEARLLGLYPADRARVEHTGKDGGKIQTESKVTHDLAARICPYLLALDDAARDSRALTPPGDSTAATDKVKG